MRVVDPPAPAVVRPATAQTGDPVLVSANPTVVAPIGDLQYEDGA